MIHPPQLTLYAIVAATTCGHMPSIPRFRFSLFERAGLVHLMHWVREPGEGRRDLQPEKAHRLTTAATSGSISGSSPPQPSRRHGGSAALAAFWSAARQPGHWFLSATGRSSSPAPPPAWAASRALRTLPRPRPGCELSRKAWRGSTGRSESTWRIDLPPIWWTLDQAAWRSACSGVIYPRAE